MRPVCARSLEMSMAYSFSVPRTTGSSISLPFHSSLAGASDIRDSFVEGNPQSTDRSPCGSPATTEAREFTASDDLRTSDGACQTRPTMDFDLTEDQLALRAGASDVLDDLASGARVRVHTTTDAPFDRALWA